MPLDWSQDCRRTNRIRIIRSRKSSIRLWRSYSNVKNLMILIRFVPCSLLTTGMCRWLSIRRNRRTKLNFWWSIVRNKLRNFYWLSKKGKLLAIRSSSNYCKSNHSLVQAMPLPTTYIETLANSSVSTTSCSQIDWRTWALNSSQTLQPPLDKPDKLRSSISIKTWQWSLIEST